MRLTIASDPLEELMQWVHEQILEAGDQVWSWFYDYNGGLQPLGSWYVNQIQSQMSAMVMATYAVLVVVGGLVIMTHESIQTRYSVKEIAPRLVIGLSLAWASPWIILGARSFIRDIVNAVLRYDKSELEHWAFDDRKPVDLLDVMHAIAFAEPLEYTLISVLTAVLLLAGVGVLAITGIMRWLAWLGVIALAPLALACHGLPFTEGVARLWWRILAACMASSIGQAGCIYLWRLTVWPSDGGLGDEFGGGASEILPKHQYLSIISIVIAIWAMWKVHAMAFQWARGRPTRIPGARMIAGIVAWRAMDRFGLGRGRRGRRASTRPSPPQGLRTRPAATPAPETAPVPSGWNDGWDGHHPTEGRSPVLRQRPRINKEAWEKVKAKPKKLQPLAPVVDGPVHERGKERAHLPIVPHRRINPAPTTPSPVHGRHPAPTPAETIGHGPGTPVPQRIIGPLRGPDAVEYTRARRRLYTTARDRQRQRRSRT